MFSSPLATSPSASEMTLPCSAVSRLAISCLFCSTSSLKRNKMALRCATLTSRQEAKASLAEATAWSTSATEAKSTSPVCSPVAGLKTGPELPEAPGVSLLSIQ